MSDTCDPARRRVGLRRFFEEASMATTSITVSETPLVLYALRRADDSLILGHRLSEWCGHAPTLEEDMALANIGLDLIGQARSLYGYAAEVEPREPGRSANDEDSYAYLRDAGQYWNLLLCEQPNRNFAHTMARQFFYSAFADPYWRAMMSSFDPTLAAVATKSEKESAYHLRHSTEWLIRLGDGTEESLARTQRAVDALWPFTGELFDADDAEDALVADRLAVHPSALRDAWSDAVDAGFARAGLRRPEGTWMQRGGRGGRHSEHLGPLLAEMQRLRRSQPGARW